MGYTTLPKYTEDKVYQNLMMLCGMMGIILEHRGVHGAYAGVLSVSKNYSISMPTEQKYLTNNPSYVLANKIASILILKSIKTCDSNGNRILELYCDQMGNGIYLLAEQMANRPNIPNSSTYKRTSAKSKNSAKTEQIQSIERHIYLTVDETAQRLGVSTKTVYTLISDGKLRAYKLSPRCVRIAPVDIDAYVMSCQICEGDDIEI